MSRDTNCLPECIVIKNCRGGVYLCGGENLDDMWRSSDRVHPSLSRGHHAAIDAWRHV